MNSHSLKVENVEIGYGRKKIIKGVSLEIPPNKITVIIGSNACGKSTLLKALARLIRPMSGQITLDGRCLETLSPKPLAQVLGFLPQSPIVPDGVAVSDLVGRGRFPHQSFVKGWSRRDHDVVRESLETMGIADLANRSIDELSGGQRQRVWIAMALAQETDILLLDEPTTYLDITYQMEILDLLTDLNKKLGKTIVMVLHDISLSSRYADHIFAISDGRLIRSGAPRDVINENLIKSVFGLDSVVIDDPVSGGPFVVPRGRYHLGAGR